MASLITPQFEHYIAEQTIANGTVVFDEFIFANIPGLNENNLAQHLTMPTAAQIVHRQAVSKKGVINENAVVYSVTIGTEVGDFDFNFIGLINKSKNLLAVAVQTATVKKTRNKNAEQGNSITRNILLEFSGAKSLTGINVSAETWQIDFTVRLHGLDEKIRLTNRDLYGRAVFFDDGFLVKRKTGNQFTLQAGFGYVEGVRMNLSAPHNITANKLPCSIYADVVHHCTVTGAYETEIKYLTQSKPDYVDTANRQHYVQILADIDSQGNVTDRRLLSPFLGMNPLELSDTTENTKDQRGHAHKLPIASIVKRGIVKLFSGFDSDSEDMAFTAKGAKGLKTLIDALRSYVTTSFILNSKKSNAVNSPSSDTVATSAAVKSANDNANGRVSKSGDTMKGILRTVGIASKQFGIGAYVNQYTSGAPFMVEETGSSAHDTYHPFIKGRVRSSGQYGTAFSLGYTTKQGEGDGFGRGVINLTEDNGTFKNWSFEHNGDFYSSNDVITGSGASLNNAHQPTKAYVETTINNSDYGGANFKRRGSAGNWDSRIEPMPDKRWKFWVQNSHETYLPAKSGTIALLGDFTNPVFTITNNVNNDAISSLTGTRFISFNNNKTATDNGLPPNMDYVGIQIADQGQQKTQILSGGTSAHYIRTNDDLSGNDWGVEKLLTDRDFTQNLSGNGWCKLPNGLIMQWGTANGGWVNFPIAFPNTCFSVTGTPGVYGNYEPYVIKDISNTKFYHQGKYTGDANNAHWIAIGR